MNDDESERAKPKDRSASDKLKNQICGAENSNDGGAERYRTADLGIANAALSQLSYSP